MRHKYRYPVEIMREFVDRNGHTISEVVWFKLRMRERYCLVNETQVRIGTLTRLVRTSWVGFKDRQFVTLGPYRGVFEATYGTIEQAYLGHRRIVEATHNPRFTELPGGTECV